jgi:hypothetical protein
VNETGANADGAYAADDGSNVAGDTYSYGSVMANRALGSVASLSLQTSFGAGFVNSTGSTITSLSVQYFGEEWRRGTVADDSLAFSYAIGTDLITGAGFTLAPNLNFASPRCGDPDSRTGPDIFGCAQLVSSTVSNLNIPAGQMFALRFDHIDRPGRSDGLAVDDFSLTPTLQTAGGAAVPEPSSWFLMLAAFAALAAVDRLRSGTNLARNKQHRPTPAFIGALADGYLFRPALRPFETIRYRTQNSGCSPTPWRRPPCVGGSRIFILRRRASSPIAPTALVLAQ